MPPLRIMAARHSAFYSPLLSALAAGFLKAEGLEATYAILPPGKRSRELIRSGEVDIMQSAVSSNWGPMERGEENLPLHFALINRRDGFFLTAREPDAAFEWRKLEGRRVLADHAFQPLAMLQYAAGRQEVKRDKVEWTDAGAPEEMDAAFRSGQGDYVHLQGPAPQQLEMEGVGVVVASVGEAMPPVAFSTLCASRSFLQTEAAQAFLRAYRKARDWVALAPPPEIAGAEARFFPGLEQETLSAAVARYQSLRCWQGDLLITRELYDQALEVFQRVGAITRRYAYEDVVLPISQPGQPGTDEGSAGPGRCSSI